MKKTDKLKGLAVMLITAGVLTAAPFTAWAATVPDGIMVDDIKLGGMTEDEARKSIEDHVNNLAKQTITLEIKGKTAAAAAGELGAFWSNSEEVVQAVRQAAGGNLIARYMKKKDLELEPVNFALSIEVDEAKVGEFVQRECEGMTDEPQNAAIVRENGQFVITPGVSGKTVDVEATTKVIDEALAGGLDHPIEIAAVIVDKDPDIKEADLQTIQDVLGTFSTDFSSSGAARSKNLQVGAAKINGKVLMPGETLSGYECMQPFTTANGYYTAAAYENGQVVDSVGGGVCQIATTLYNASLLAELEITERQNHSMIVNYVKPSRDAAIAGTAKDIKVTNNYSTPIYVEGGTNGRTLFFTIYGKETRPENRTIEYVSETLGSTDPGAPTTKVDPSLAPGARKQVQSAHRGLRSRLWKCVYIDGVETEKTLLHTDNYMASKAIVLVGPEVPASAEPAESAPADTAASISETTETQAPIEGINGGPGMTAAPETPAPTAAPAAAETQPDPTPETQPAAAPETPAAADPVQEAAPVQEAPGE